MRTIYHLLFTGVALGALLACSEPTQPTTAQKVGSTAVANRTDQSEPASVPILAQSLTQLQNIHQRILVLDAHADIEIAGQESRYVGADGRSQVALDKLQAGGVDAVVMAIAVGPGPRDSEGHAKARARADKELAYILALTGDATNNSVLVKSAAELSGAHAQGKTAIILGFQNARILGGDVAAIDEFYAAGVRVFALSHMGHNDFTDSSRPIFISELGHHEPIAEHGGLSTLGKQAITKLNALGAVIDISQLSKQATLQVLAMSSAPVIASHSNVQQLTQVSRNLSDQEIDAIGAIGGVIHVAPFRGYLFDSTDKNMDKQIRVARVAAGIEEDYLYPFELYWEIDDSTIQTAFLTTVSELLGPSSIDAMIDHIDYIKARIGIDHVGIGTDFNHGSGLAGFNDASEAMNVTAALLRRGYSQQDIEKIWGANFLRVFKAVAANEKQALNTH